MKSTFADLPKELYSLILSKNEGIEDTVTAAMNVPEMMIAYDNRRDTTHFWKDLLLEKYDLEIDEKLTIANLERIFLMLKSPKAFKDVIYLPDILLTIKIIKDNKGLKDGKLKLEKNGLKSTSKNDARLISKVKDLIQLYVDICLKHNTANLISHLEKIFPKETRLILRNFLRRFFSPRDVDDLKKIVKSLDMLVNLQKIYPDLIPDEFVYEGNFESNRRSDHLEKILRLRQTLSEKGINIVLDGEYIRDLIDYLWKLYSKYLSKDTSIEDVLIHMSDVPKKQVKSNLTAIDTFNDFILAVQIEMNESHIYNFMNYDEIVKGLKRISRGRNDIIHFLEKLILNVPMPILRGFMRDVPKLKKILSNPELLASLYKEDHKKFSQLFKHLIKDKEKDDIKMLVKELIYYIENLGYSESPQLIKGKIMKIVRSVYPEEDEITGEEESVEEESD